MSRQPNLKDLRKQIKEQDDERRQDKWWFIIIITICLFAYLHKHGL